MFRPKCFLIFILFSGSLLLQHCPTQPPEEPPDPATLSVAYTNAAEVWLRVQAPDSTAAGLRVYRGEHLVAEYATPPADTVVIDTGLTPRTTYIYSTMRVQSGAETAASEPVPVTTLPTTSHHFTWTVDTLGTAGSYLRDVAIVDEDDIWAVGKIVTDSLEYNAVHWNGKNWEFISIDRKVDFDGIIAFGRNDIWFSDGCFVYRFNGNEYIKQWECDWEEKGPNQATSIWSQSPESLYFFGKNGNIIRYDGMEFKYIQSETTDWIIDLFGTGPTDVWAVTYAEYPHRNTVRHWNGVTWTTRWQYESGALPPATRAHPAGLLTSGYAAGEVLFLGCALVYTWVPAVRTGRLTLSRDLGWPVRRGAERIRGAGPNDVVVVSGTGSHAAHWNGATWVTLPGLAALDPGATFFTMGLAVTPETVALAGLSDATGQAILYRGHRQ